MFFGARHPPNRLYDDKSKRHADIDHGEFVIPISESHDVRCSGPLLRTTVGALRLLGMGAYFALGVVSRSMGAACRSRCRQVSRSASKIDGVQVNESYIM